MRNEVQLITYADRLGGDLVGLRKVLTERFGDAFGGVHILPFFTPYDGADAGFDPIDHTQVDPRLGSWDDVRAITETHDVMVDLIVNHVSTDSAAFRDVMARGEASPHAGLFLTMSSVFPDGAGEDELTGIYRPRPGLPFTVMRLGRRSRLVWTTFTPQQVDIDVESPAGSAYLQSILDGVAAAGVTSVRLDAVGYAIKRPGTSCFMIPETFAFIERFAADAGRHGIEVLVEVHSHYERQIAIGRSVDLVYDFALPPLVLHALYTADATVLARWMEVRPPNAITVLDTHDGIGVIDVGPEQITEPGLDRRPGLLTPDQIDALVHGIHEHSGGASARATGAAASNLDLYQVNSTFYGALGCDDRRYLAARAIQFFTPGVPQVYYVGALAGDNDLELLTRTGVGRDINRHHYTAAELDDELRRPVVRAQLDLCRFRNRFPAFDGELVTTATDGALIMRRTGRADPAAWAELRVDLDTGDASISWGADGVSGRTDDLLGRPPTA
ncbi:MAG TPA: sucrose phosphorylase [Microlunatus sp.]|nr:sucrose phosphorylase [Microlunatus sp.]